MGNKGIKIRERDGKIVQWTSAGDKIRAGSEGVLWNGGERAGSTALVFKWYGPGL